MELLPAKSLLQKLQACHLLPEDWESLSAENKELARYTDSQALLNALVLRGHLTAFQAERIKAGAMDELVVGNYRLLERLGEGSVGTVYKGRHLRMDTEVALKVVPLPPALTGPDLARLFASVRAVARLQHPHVAAVIDTGELPAVRPGEVNRQYFVTEFLPGHDLHQLVIRKGPLTIAQACAVVYQIASALAETHQHHLVHGDIKPSNIRLLGDGQAKLLDFALARNLSTRGNFSEGPDFHADIQSLGQILFWCLTGKALGDSPMVSSRSYRSDIPPELDEVVLDLLCEDGRGALLIPQAVMRALVPFLRAPLPVAVSGAGTAGLLVRTEFLPADLAPSARDLASLPPPRVAVGEHVHRVLIVDDEPSIRHFSRLALQAEGLPCDEACNGVQALAAFQILRYDLVLLDIDMPEMNGLEVCRRLRQNPPEPHLKIIMFSGRSTPDDLAQLLLTGADDYLTKPFTPMQLQARVLAALRLKKAQERSDLLNHDLLVVNRELEQHLNARAGDLIQARNALVLALAKLVEYRDTETGEHLLRIQVFSRRLAEEARKSPSFAGQVDDHFIDMLACCAPLHDIGKVGLPDHILLKPSKLEPDERLIMQAHTTIGADTLQQVARQHGFALAFLQMSIDITRHHHERYDGHGYPDRLAGSAIPLSARLVTICDVYDALRSRRVYKPPMPHETTVQLMEEGSGGQFDPALMQVFQRCAADFERIYAELSD